MEKIIIRTLHEEPDLLLDVIRILFPECEVRILTDQDKGRTNQEA